MTAVAAYFWYKHKQSSDNAAVQAAVAAQQAAATSAAAPYQPYTVPYVTSSSNYGGSYGNGYNGIRQHGPAPQGNWQPPMSQASGMTQTSYPGASPAATPASQAPGSRNLGQGFKILGGSGNYKLVGGGAVNNLGSGVTSLSQADARAQQYGAP